jgi:predicted nucleic acid-binding protein
MPAYIVVDASVAGAWAFPETFSLLAQPVLAAVAANRVTALAPDRFVEEVLRICQKKILPPPTGAGVTPADAWERFLEIVTCPIVFLPSDELHERAWQLALNTGLTTHDALYLAAAERWEAELWTLDVELASPALSAYAQVRDLRTVGSPH